MATCIRDNEEIEGLTFNESKLKLSQFADDSICFLANGRSLNKLLSFLQTFANGLD